MLKRFSMKDSKRGFLPMSHGIKLSKSQCLTTKDERERMDKILGICFGYWFYHVCHDLYST